MEDRISGWLHYHCKACCKKGGHHRRQALWLEGDITVGM